MFTNWFGQPSATTHIYEWRYAMEHPYLYAAIKIMQPYTTVVICLAGYAVVRALWRKV